jgi:hypothetical protein
MCRGASWRISTEQQLVNRTWPVRDHLGVYGGELYETVNFQLVS